MWAYVFGVVIILLLASVPVRVVLAEAVKRFKVSVGQQMVYWAIAMLFIYGVVMLMTDTVLPSSQLVVSWSYAELKGAASWSYFLGFVTVIYLFWQQWQTQLLSIYKNLKPAPKARTRGASKPKKARR